MVGLTRRAFLGHTSELGQFPDPSFVAAAVDAVIRAKDTPVDMAYFTARDGKPADYCENEVRGCDIYVGLIGLRYGSLVRDRSALSHTELEFDTATKMGMKRLVFLLDEDAALPIPPAMLLDRDPDLQARQRGFRERLLNAEDITVAKVSSPEQLRLLLLQALLESKPTVEAATARHRARVPAAGRLVGRDAEVSSLVAAWLAVPSRPVAVLGAPGIGKSAICLTALHHERVQQQFGDRRWFIRCDGIPSADALLSGMAAELGVTAGGSASLMMDRVYDELAGNPAVVVLDNFETPWMAEPLPVEDLLRTLAEMPQVGTAVTARGTLRPAGLDWWDFAMTSPLTLPDARRVFLGVAGTKFEADPKLDELLDELDGVPLAVELMGYAAQGQPNLDGVAKRWQHERVTMLKRMRGDKPELSVPVSVEASITSPRMDYAARRLLTLLGVLHDGITEDGLAGLMPGTGLAAAATLRQVGLAFDEGDRLRTLAPIRDYVAAAYPPEPSDLAGAISRYPHLVQNRIAGRSQ
jgi:Domain of unknown function (DUF4062)